MGLLNYILMDHSGMCYKNITKILRELFFSLILLSLTISNALAITSYGEGSYGAEIYGKSISTSNETLDNDNEDKNNINNDIDK